MAESSVTLPAIPTFGGGGGGGGIFLGAEARLDIKTTGDPGVEKELGGYTVPPNLTRYLFSLHYSTGANGLLTIKADGVIIWSDRTGASFKNGTYVWSPARGLPTGTEIKVFYTQTALVTVDADIEVYLAAGDLEI